MNKLIHIICLVITFQFLSAADWPQWRADAGHTASTTEQLAKDLSLHWHLQLSKREQVWDDPLNNDVMQYDKIFEPIVANNLVYVSFNDRDCVIAYDLKTGKQRWQFFCSAPVRFPPVAWQKKLYVASDDGYLYCLNAVDGSQLWSFSAAPAQRSIIGNKRVISTWPLRGAPVIKNDTLYCAASIWPFMGTFFYALNPSNGEVIWENDGMGAQYLRQPHAAPSFAGIAPQGILTATDKYLIIPGGRSMPAVFDRATGKQRYFRHGGKGFGGSFICASEPQLFIHTRRREVSAAALDTGKLMKLRIQEPVLANGLIYGQVPIYKDKKITGSSVRAYNQAHELIWSLPVDARGDLILAGDALYAAGTETLTTIRLSDEGKKAVVEKTMPLPAQVQRLLAADGHLIAVTLDGGIYAYAEGKVEPTVHKPSPLKLELKTKVLDAIKDCPKDGYAFLYNVQNDLLQQLLVHTQLQILLIESDATRCQRLRSFYDRYGLYGKRLQVQHGDLGTYRAPQYAASLTIIDNRCADQINKDSLALIHQSVRPYGGLLVMPNARHHDAVLALEQMQQKKTQSWAKSQRVYARVGALPGSDNWTHQNGNVANTRKSNDKRVKLPLGVLWFGGSSNLDVLPRHGHGPTEQVIGGRLYIEGMDLISCRDVYTGRVLWKRQLDDLGNAGVYFDHTYKDTPLSTAYNQVHIPGANGRGTNYIATEDIIYVVTKSKCLLLDALTGETRSTISLGKDPDTQQEPEWAYIGVYEDYLLAGVGFGDFHKKSGVEVDRKSITWARTTDKSACLALRAYDRHSGKRLWEQKAEFSFIHNGIVAGADRVYCLDRFPKSYEKILRRMGKKFDNNYSVRSFDIKTGKQIWEHREHVFGTWLGYSADEDYLLQAGARARDRLHDEVGQGMQVLHADSGKEKWYIADLKYTGPCVIHNGIIITGANSYEVMAGAFVLESGKPAMRVNPITGKEEKWAFNRAYGCNTLIASEHLLTFRSGAAGFYDLNSKIGTGNFGGFKSSCTSNLVVANGVLNAPDYTRTCSCSYQNQTSLAMVHMPDVEIWTAGHVSKRDTDKLPKSITKYDSAAVRQIGINCAAPGDRLASNEVLWLDVPSVGGVSANIDVSYNEDAKVLRRHSLSMNGKDAKGEDVKAYTWVAASALINLKSLRVKLGQTSKTYKVRLFFAEIDRKKKGERVFDISIEGKVVAKAYDVMAKAKRVNTLHIIEHSVLVEDDELEIQLTPKTGKPLLNGVEIIEQ